MTTPRLTLVLQIHDAHAGGRRMYEGAMLRAGAVWVRTPRRSTPEQARDAAVEICRAAGWRLLFLRKEIA